MRSYSPKFKTLTKLAAAFLLISVSGIYQCKSTIDDVAPETEEKVSLPDAESAVKTFSKTNMVAGATLKNTFSFPIGAAVVKERLDNDTYSFVVNREFSSITPESSMKFGSLHPAKDRYDFVKADAIVAYAQAHNMRVHGHTLLWAKDSGEPKWLLQFEGDKKAWDKLLKDHIYTVVKHFKGKIASWDVVNEAINDNGTWKNTIWYRKLGLDYIRRAFKYAHEADPNAKLFYNDYGQEYGYHKMTTILNLIDLAKKHNLRFDGIGFQMHFQLRMHTDLLRKSFQQIAEKGKLIHLSEFDINVKSGLPKGGFLSPNLNDLQSAKYKEIVKLYMEMVPAKLQWGITMWGVGDGDSYFYKYGTQTSYPLLFDLQYNAKPSYKGFLEAGLGK